MSAAARRAPHAARRRAARIAVTVSCALTAVFPLAAEAHHSILISEVRASTASPGSAFVELQAYRQGQNLIAGSDLVVYDQTGMAPQVFPLDKDVANADSQRTILAAGADLAGVADFSFAGLGSALSASGGAVCLPEAAPPDCVSWGAFSGFSLLPFPGAGAPAPAISEGSSLGRTISRGCALGLDSEDDSDSSAADFALGAPTPLPNSAPPPGRDCVPCAGADATIIGTDGSDVIRGTPGRDVIAALAGADTVRGLGGRDAICGGIGKDLLLGGKGGDKLFGGRGRDTCRGGRGRDSTRSCEAGPSR